MTLKDKIDEIIKSLNIQPVGSGYIDCICQMEHVADFIDAMSHLNITITEFTWWCLADDDHKPCGIGGSKNRYADGNYSEMCMGQTLEFSSHYEMKKYLLDEWKKSDMYRPCFRPAFWLDVPDNWKNPWCGL